MAFPEDIRLIKWIVSHVRDTVHNLSNSGLPEPLLSDMGIDTSFETMKAKSVDPADHFLDQLCNLYGFERKSVVLTTGGSESILLMSLLAKSKDLPVFVGLPEYEPIFMVPESMGVRTETAGFGDIEKKMSLQPGTKAFFFSNPNNPLGILHRKEFLQSIRERNFRSGDGFMYADEAFLEFASRSMPMSFYEDSPEIAINGSLTKFYGFSGFRVGWIVASDSNVERLSKIRTITGIRNPDYPLWIAAQCLENRNSFQKRAERIFSSNIAMLRKFMQEHDKLSWIEPDSAAFALIHYSYDIDSEEFCKSAFDKERILLDPGDYFGAERSVRLCFTEEPEKFQSSLEAFDRFLTQLH